MPESADGAWRFRVVLGRTARLPVAVGAGMLQLSLVLLGAGLEPGAGVLCRRDLGFEPRFLLALVPRGVLAGPPYLPVRGLAGTVQLRAGRLGSLPRPGRVLRGGPDPGLCLARLAVRLAPLLLRRGHLLLGGPLGLEARACAAVLSCPAAALAAATSASCASACSAAERASLASASFC